MWRALPMAALFLLFAACRNAPERKASQYPDAPVIIISIDALRADRLAMFGGLRVETPHLDRLRSDAILYTNAYTHAPLTLPAHASLLTGLLPFDHGVRNDIGYRLRAGIPTLQRSLKARGYATGAAVSAYVLRGSTGLAQDFDEYDDRIPALEGAPVTRLSRPGRVTAQLASQWIEARPAGEPFFFFLHLFEPHAPYEPESPFRERYRDPYDGEIATVDAVVGEFLDRLRRADLYDKAIIVLLSDHGEALGDHGEFEHGIFLYRATSHVPLLVKLPGGERRNETVTTPVGLVDVAPTVAALTGLGPLLGRHGHSMLELPPQRRIYVESLYPRIHLGWSELRSLAGGRYQYIDAPRPELYELYDDPRQRKSIVEREWRIAARMRVELSGYGREASAPRDAGTLDPKDGVGEIEAVRRANRLLEARRWDDAAEAFHAITATNPRHTEGWGQLARALQSSGRSEEASEIYGRLIDSAPELESEFGLRRGAILLELGRLDEAERHARLAEATSRGAMHVLLARIELARGNAGGAEAQARAATTDANHRLSGELLLAQILVRQERAAEALVVLERASAEIERHGLGPVESYEFVRGEVLAGLERHEEAIEAFRREIEHFPGSRQAYASLSLLYMAKGEEGEAVRTLEQMVRANPGPSSLLLAARTMELAGDAERAGQWRSRAGVSQESGAGPGGC